MAVKIDTDARIAKIRVQEQGSDPTNPTSGYGWVYERDDGVLYLKNDGGDRMPLSIKTSVEALTSSGTYSAVPNTRYIFDISGLSGNKNFTLPSGTVGDEVEVNLSVGDDTYGLILVGAAGVKINNGSLATEWSRLFITGESVKMVLTTGGNWQVVYDGRISCEGKMTLSAADTTNTAGTETLPTWDNAVINQGDICDLVNKRFNIRRAGNYLVGGSAYGNGVVNDQKYYYVTIRQNATAIGGNVTRGSGAGGGNMTAHTSVNAVLAVGDAIYFYYAPEEANVGIVANQNSNFWIEEI